ATVGAQTYHTTSLSNLAGTYRTQNANFTITGPAEFDQNVVIDTGSGNVTLGGAAKGTSPFGRLTGLALVGSANASFADITNLSSFDLSGKTGGTVDVSGRLDTASLVTVAAPYSLALRGGGTIGAAQLLNTGAGGVAPLQLAGGFIFSNGLALGAS